MCLLSKRVVILRKKPESLLRKFFLLSRFFRAAAVNTWLLFVGKRWVDEAARRLFSAILKTKPGLNDVGSRFYFGEGA